MDKRKVITAYRRGFITLQECAQILGIDSKQIIGIMQEPDRGAGSRFMQKQSVNG
jgi:hypothetical protein